MDFLALLSLQFYPRETRGHPRATEDLQGPFWTYSVIDSIPIRFPHHDKLQRAHLFRAPFGDPIGNIEQNRIWGLRWSEGQFFNDYLKNGKCYKLRPYILINISLVDWNFHFLKNRRVFIFMISRASGNAILILPFQRTRTQRPLFRPSVRPSVRARVRRLPKLVIISRLSNISENHLRKIQYLSASIVKPRFLQRQEEEKNFWLLILRVTPSAAGPFWLLGVTI